MRVECEVTALKLEALKGLCCRLSMNDEIGGETVVRDDG